MIPRQWRSAVVQPLAPKSACSWLQIRSSSLSRAFAHSLDTLNRNVAVMKGKFQFRMYSVHPCGPLHHTTLTCQLGLQDLARFPSTDRPHCKSRSSKQPAGLIHPFLSLFSEHTCSLATHTDAGCLLVAHVSKTRLKKERKHERFITAGVPSTHTHRHQLGPKAPLPVCYITFSFFL